MKRSGASVWPWALVLLAFIARAAPASEPSPAYGDYPSAYDSGYYTNLTTWFNWNPRWDYLYDYLDKYHPEVLSGDAPVTIFVPIGSNKTWEDALWPLPLPPAFLPRLVVPYVYKSYEELVEAGSVTTYDNTTIKFSYNDYFEVLGEWQDPTHARAAIDYAVYPYGKSVIYAIQPYTWVFNPSPSPGASPDYNSPRPPDYPLPSPTYEGPSPPRFPPIPPPTPYNPNITVAPGKRRLKL
ncbi:hypothetical protein N2152v2_002795 [Parachlorella kessleri]